MKLPGAEEIETPKGNVREVEKGLFTMKWAGLREPAGDSDALPPSPSPSNIGKPFEPLDLKRKGRSCKESRRTEVTGERLLNRIGGLKMFSKLRFGIEGAGQ